ncbi:MAG: hypothetical protein LBU18_03705 [Treponema sp.]|jgi:hypothetical protein|nr:hypothetical protein [Treponema sp.]
MRKLICILLFASFFALSCKTEPEYVASQPELPSAPQSAAVEIPFQPPEPAAEEEAFDPNNVSQELFDATLLEVQQFISALNSIIRAQKYEEWIKNLSQEYIDTYSSPDYLRKASLDPLFRREKIVLRNLRDFFIYNVVPSRANIDKVEVNDIEFITPTRVKSYTVNEKGQRLRLYELEKNGDAWKIVR